MVFFDKQDIIVGYMNNRLKYLRSRERAANAPAKSQNGALVDGGGECSDSDDDDHEDNAVAILDETDLKDLIEKMKAIRVSDESMDEIKRNLRITRQYRQNLMSVMEVELIEAFPYFFADADLSAKLISFEFEDRFGPLSAENDFVAQWKKHADVLDELIKSQFEAQMFYTNWSDDIEMLLIPLKLFPSNRTGKNKLAQRDTFYKASQKLIVYRQVRFDCSSYHWNL